LYYLLKTIEKEKDELVSVCWNRFFGKVKRNHYENKIQEIEEIRMSLLNEYVYDIETETGDFQAGIGQLIVKNTDSIFIDFSDEIKNQNPGKELTEKDLLVESIKIGEMAAANINSKMKAPQNIEYEKTFWPFCIFSKKRYFGNKYEHNPEKYKQTSMGIVLKRRDNAPIVKTIYGGVIDIILNQRDINKSKQFFYDSIKNLLEGNVDITELVVSKTVKTDYANPNQIAHKVLADRITARDPGNKPSSGDRIPFVYIVTPNKKALQGDKIETPTIIKENDLKIDYSFYITNQIMKPLQQVFALVIEKIWQMQNKKPKLNRFKRDIENLKKEYLENPEKLQDKIETLRCKEIKTLLFDEYLRETNNEKEGFQSLTKFFTKK
jgi:DNA polymerase elongation subunit (family B)